MNRWCNGLSHYPCHFIRFHLSDSAPRRFYPQHIPYMKKKKWGKMGSSFIVKRLPESGVRTLLNAFDYFAGISYEAPCASALGQQIDWNVCWNDGKQWAYSKLRWFAVLDLLTIVPLHVIHWFECAGWRKKRTAKATPTGEQVNRADRGNTITLWSITFLTLWLPRCLLSILFRALSLFSCWLCAVPAVTE